MSDADAAEIVIVAVRYECRPEEKYTRRGKREISSVIDARLSKEAWGLASGSELCSDEFHAQRFLAASRDEADKS